MLSRLRYQSRHLSSRVRHCCLTNDRQPKADRLQHLGASRSIAAAAAGRRVPGRPCAVDGERRSLLLRRIVDTTVQNAAREAILGHLRGLRALPHPPAHGASRSPSTKNGSISLYSRIFTAGAAGPLPCASAKNTCSDCATMARARSFL